MGTENTTPAPPAAVTRTYYYAGGQRVAMRENGTLFYLLGDHLGSTAYTANSRGARTGELRYKAWGETRYAEGVAPTEVHFTGQNELVGRSIHGIIALHFYIDR